MSGTENCYPPEFFTGGVTTGEDLDRWCVALVLYTMIECSIAFKTPQEIVFNSPILSNGFSPAFLDLITSMLHKNPQRRLNYEELIAHPWIFSYDTPVSKFY